MLLSLTASSLPETTLLRGTTLTGEIIRRAIPLQATHAITTILPPLAARRVTLVLLRLRRGTTETTLPSLLHALLGTMTIIG